MDKKIRYLILLFGFLVFLVLAPLIVLYVTGNSIDPDTLRPVKTGILSAKSIPTNAEIFIDDELADKTDYNIRLLRPKEYNVRLEKEGYFSWSKRLPIWENQITLLAQGVDAVHLIKTPTTPVSISPNVTDFQQNSSSLWYISGDVLIQSVIDDPSNSSNYKLSFVPNRLDLLNNNQYLFTANSTNSAVINSDNKTVYNLPQNNLNFNQVKVLPNNKLMLLVDRLLLSYDLETGTQQPLIPDVAIHTVEGSTVYWQKDGSIFSGQWSGDSLLNINTLVTDTSLNTPARELLVTNRKEMFVLIDNKFYRVNLNLRLLNEQTISASIIPHTNEIVFSTGSELWFYNLGLNEPQLLTRSNASLKQFIIRTAIGYGFMITNDGLHALEIDNRDRQNDYQLVESPNISKIILGPQDKYVFYLDNNELKSIIIK